MVLVTLAACVGSYVQEIFKRYVGEGIKYEWSGVTVTESNYNYNYIMYFVGLIFFGVAIFLIYKKFSRVFELISKVNVVSIIIAWIVIVVWGCLMVFCLFWLMLENMNQRMFPQCMKFVTVLGWPMAVVVIMSVIFICKRKVRA